MTWLARRLLGRPHAPARRPGRRLPARLFRPLLLPLEDRVVMDATPPFVWIVPQGRFGEGDNEILFIAYWSGEAGQPYAPFSVPFTYGGTAIPSPSGSAPVPGADYYEARHGNSFRFGGTGTGYPADPVHPDPSEAAGSIYLPLIGIDDTRVEGSESLEITLQPGSGYTLGPPVARDILMDNDPPAEVGDCGCGVGGLTAPVPYGNGPSDSGSDGTRFPTGTLFTPIPGLGSGNPDGGFDPTLYYTSDPQDLAAGEAPSGDPIGGERPAGGSPFGGGVGSTQAPRLAEFTDSPIDRIVTTLVLFDGSHRYFYDGQGTAGADGYYPTYVPRRPGTGSVAYDAAPKRLVLTDDGGQTFRFVSADPDMPGAAWGGLDSMAAPGGAATAVAARGADGLPTDVRWTDPADPNVITSYLTAYAVGRATGVARRHSADGGATWLPAGGLAYTYYGPSDPNGAEGQLETVTVTDAGGATTDEAYYRYYTADTVVGGAHVGVPGGLKYVFGKDAVGRMAADLGGPAGGPSDAAVAAYADRYYEYDAARRVTRAVVAGAGCSACSGGLGASTYAYAAGPGGPAPNSWAVRTVVGNPDGSTDAVYTNRLGEVMLRDHSDGTGHWVDYYRYDADGRLVLHAARRP